MSQQQEPSVREKIMEKAKSLGEKKTEIEASELPPHVKEKMIDAIDSELERLAKAYNSLLRK